MRTGPPRPRWPSSPVTTHHHHILSPYPSSKPTNACGRRLRNNHCHLGTLSCWYSLPPDHLPSLVLADRTMPPVNDGTRGAAVDVPGVEDPIGASTSARSCTCITSGPRQCAGTNADAAPPPTGATTGTDGPRRPAGPEELVAAPAPATEPAASRPAVPASWPAPAASCWPRSSDGCA